MFGGQQRIAIEERLALGAIDLALQLIVEQGFDEPPPSPPGGTPPGSPPHPPSPPPTPPPPPPSPPGPPVRRRRRRGPNIPRQSFSSVGMSPAYILRTFRLDMPTIVSIVAEIQQDLQPAIAIQTAVPPLLKLLGVLHFCATGSYQHSVGMGHGTSQPMFSRILKQVLAAMIRVVDRHIFFPQDQAAFLHHKGQFYAIANMPHTIGCIDCTHVAIVPPLEHEAAYRNRKMQHTLNVQMVCDSMLCIQYVCARYPGSCHDATVLRGSALYPFMEGLADQRLWLLGEYMGCLA